MCEIQKSISKYIFNKYTVFTIKTNLFYKINLTNYEV